MNRLYYDDSYVRRFHATAETGASASGPPRVYLDRTAFYPTSGGQPHDTGLIGPARVVDAIDEEDGRIAHLLDRPLEPGWHPCEIDWPRRFDHMQQHTGQHLLSAVLADAFKIPTVSFHLGAEASTIDVETSAQFDQGSLVEAERRANELIFENRPITVSYHDAREDLGLRKPADREGTIRVVTIEDLDRSACGGTHVASTAAIGPVLIRRLDKIRGNLRIEFLCGRRAVERARADFDALSAVARQFSSPLDQAPALIAAQAARLAEAEKLARKYSLELAAIRGRELHAATAPNARGLRVHVLEIAKGPIADDVRAQAQAFAGSGGAVFAALCAEPPSILLCVSPGGPVKAGPALDAALKAEGGRGGGHAAMAQGSAPSGEALARVWSSISSALA